MGTPSDRLLLGAAIASLLLGAVVLTVTLT